MPRAKKPVEASTTPDLEIPLPADGIGSLDYWQDEVDKATRRRKKEIEGWKRNLNRAYRGMSESFFGLSKNETIIIPTDFYYAEQKKAQLFFQTPYVQLTAEQPEPEQAIPYYQHVVNFLLGPRGADAKATVSQCLTDVVVASGFGPVEIGYEAVQVDVAMPTNRMEPVIDPLTGQPALEQVIDPMTGQPSMDPNMLQPKQQLALDPETMQPETVIVKKTIWCKYFIDHFSPAKALLPVGLATTQYDKGPWIGRDFDADAQQMKQWFGVKSSELGEYRDDQSLAPSNDKEFLRDTARGCVIYYQARIYDEKAYPDEIRKLILINGKKKEQTAVVHERLKYQVFDADGKLVGGMRGFPIDPLAIRSVTDTAYPPSDASVAAPVSNELSIGRSQMIKQRTRNIPIRAIDSLRVDKTIVDRLERGDWQAIIPFKGAMDESVFRELASANFPNENFAFNNITEGTLEKIWGLGANQLGASTDETKSATESTLVEQAKDIRMSADRTAVLEWFQRVVEKFASLPLIFADHEQLVEIEGPDGAKRLETWDKTKIQGRYAFSLRPDSAVRVNAAEMREQGLRFYNLTANSPFVNQLENMKELARSLGKNPNLVQQPPPPQPPPPEKPKISVSIKGDDLNPLMPQYANVMLILQGGDVSQLQPPAPVQMQPITSAQTAQPISKHAADLTGQQSGPPMPKEVM
jgi:hypothetical protein